MKDFQENISKKQAPWFSSGWFNTIEHWIKKSAEGAGIKINGEIEKIKITDLSAVLLIPAEEGSLYFKAVIPQAAYEAELSKHLNKLFKGKSADIIDINEKEGWLLMRDIKGHPLRELRDKALWQRAINEYAKLQVQEVENTDMLISMGVPDRRLHKLRDEIDKNLEAMCATGLNEEETSKILALKPELLRMCEDMEGIVPTSIEHGDLHSNNIRLSEEEIVFFDWGDAAVAHPFFSTRIFWNSIDELITSEDEWLDMVNEFKPYYLEPWRKFAPMEDLEKLLLISDQLACVYRALSWYLYINLNREKLQESYIKPSQWLQLLLEHREIIGLK